MSHKDSTVSNLKLTVLGMVFNSLIDMEALDVFDPLDTGIRKNGRDRFENGVFLLTDNSGIGLRSVIVII